METGKLSLLIGRPTESIPERVVRRVRQAIADGLLPPGQRLTERELMELTGVSRTSIREAVRLLQMLGLVEVARNRGVRVAVLGSDEVREIYEMREALEPAVAALFASRATDQDVAAAVEKLQPRSSADDQLRAIYEFEELLLEGARNSLLKATLGSLRLRIHAVHSLYPAIPGPLEQRLEEHAQLVAAIEDRSPVLAAEVARAHVQAAARAALETLSALEQG